MKIERETYMIEKRRRGRRERERESAREREKEERERRERQLIHANHPRPCPNLLQLADDVGRQSGPPTAVVHGEAGRRLVLAVEGGRLHDGVDLLHVLVDVVDAVDELPQPPALHPQDVLVAGPRNEAHEGASERRHDVTAGSARHGADRLD